MMRRSRRTAVESERNEGQIAGRLVYFALHPEEIQRRLNELDRERSIESVLQVNAAAAGLLGFALAMVRGRRYLLVPAAINAFLVGQAMQGWSAPVRLLRRLGYRTLREIERERHALKALRGDFERVREGDVDARVRAALDAVGSRDAVPSPSVAPSV